MKIKVKGFLIIVTVIFMFFFSSKLTLSSFYKQKNFKYTPLNTTYNLEENIDVSILSWSYDKKKELMEIEVKIINNTEQQNDNYSYLALCRKGVYSKQRKVPVKLVSEEGFYKIFHLDLKNKKFNEVSFKIKIKENEISFYTNKDDVNKEKVSILTNEQYKQRRIGYTIKEYKKEYNSLKEDIRKKQEAIKNMDEINTRLLEELELESEKEQEEREAIVWENIEKQESYEEDIKENKKRMKELEKLINDLEKTDKKEQ